MQTVLPVKAWVKSLPTEVQDRSFIPLECLDSSQPQEQMDKLQALGMGIRLFIYLAKPYSQGFPPLMGSEPGLLLTYRWIPTLRQSR